MTEDKFVENGTEPSGYNAAKTSASIYTNILIIFFGKGAFFTLLFSTKMSTKPTNITVKPLARWSWFHLSIEILMSFLWSIKVLTRENCCQFITVTLHFGSLLL